MNGRFYTYADTNTWFSSVFNVVFGSDSSD